MNSNCNTTTCPFCGAECGSHTRLITHMIACAASRVNWNSGKLVAAIAAGLVALSLLVAQPAKAQDVPTPTPTVTVDVAPSNPVPHNVYLPYISTAETVHGCDDCQAVSWRPTGDAKL